MSLSSSARPVLSTLCRQCRQRYFQKPHSQTAKLLSSSARSLAVEQQDDRASTAPLRMANQSGYQEDDGADYVPRWKRAPSAMRSPFRIREANDNDDFPVNDDPQKLDEALKRVLGQGGDTMLSDEAKWLAVTHKSFDHGRRGFNDRLAFLGRQIVNLQTSLALIDAPKGPATSAAGASDLYGRIPFQHPALANVEGIRGDRKSEVLSKERLAQLANRYELGKVVRWKPKQVHRLKESGFDSVLAHTVYAIVGAVALQRGGDAAVQAVRQRILRPLGVL